MSTNCGRRAQPLGVGAERRVDVQAVATAGAGLVLRLHRGIGVGNKNHPVEIAADIGLQRRTQLRELVRANPVQGFLRVGDADDGAALS